MDPRGSLRALGTIANSFAFSRLISSVPQTWSWFLLLLHLHPLPSNLPSTIPFLHLLPLCDLSCGPPHLCGRRSCLQLRTSDVLPPASQLYTQGQWSTSFFPSFKDDSDIASCTSCAILEDADIASSVLRTGTMSKNKKKKSRGLRTVDLLLLTPPTFAWSLPFFHLINLCFFCRSAKASVLLLLQLLQFLEDLHPKILFAVFCMSFLLTIRSVRTSCLPLECSTSSLSVKQHFSSFTKRFY